MKRLNKNIVWGIWMAALFAAYIGVAIAQPSGLPFEGTIRYVASCPTVGSFPGQLCVEFVSGSDLIVKMWNSNDVAWEEVFGDSASITVEDVTASDDVVVGDALTVTGATTFTGATTANGAVTLGSNDADNITINGPVTRNVLRADFTYPSYFFVEEDFTAAVVTDTAENIAILPLEQIQVFGFRLEQAYAANVGTTAFTGDGRWTLSAMADLVDTDGVDYKIGGTSLTGTGFNVIHTSQFSETSSSSTYCEIKVKITTIANIDEFYFGWALEGAYPDANDITALNTTAYFRIPDNAGDLDIETELNAGGTLNDDTGVTWADGNEKTLRVTMSADTVTFALDGAAVTQTNAVLNADDGDLLTCNWGFQNSAVGVTAGLSLDYVELGVSQ